jgi:hypothetical protein
MRMNNVGSGNGGGGDSGNTTRREKQSNIHRVVAKKLVDTKNQMNDLRRVPQPLSACGSIALGKSLEGTGAFLHAKLSSLPPSGGWLSAVVNGERNGNTAQKSSSEALSPEVTKILREGLSRAAELADSSGDSVGTSDLSSPSETNALLLSLLVRIVSDHVNESSAEEPGCPGSLGSLLANRKKNAASQPDSKANVNDKSKSGPNVIMEALLKLPPNALAAITPAALGAALGKGDSGDGKRNAKEEKVPNVPISAKEREHKSMDIDNEGNHQVGRGPSSGNQSSAEKSDIKKTTSSPTEKEKKENEDENNKKRTVALDKLFADLLKNNEKSEVTDALKQPILPEYFPDSAFAEHHHSASTDGISDQLADSHKLLLNAFLGDSRAGDLLKSVSSVSGSTLTPTLSTFSNSSKSYDAYFSDTAVEPQHLLSSAIINERIPNVDKLPYGFRIMDYFGQSLDFCFKTGEEMDFIQDHYHRVFNNFGERGRAQVRTEILRKIPGAVAGIRGMTEEANAIRQMTEGEDYLQGKQSSKTSNTPRKLHFGFSAPLTGYVQTAFQDSFYEPVPKSQKFSGRFGKSWAPLRELLDTQFPVTGDWMSGVRGRKQSNTVAGVHSSRYFSGGIGGLSEASMQGMDKVIGNSAIENVGCSDKKSVNSEVLKTGDIVGSLGVGFTHSILPKASILPPPMMQASDNIATDLTFQQVTPQQQNPVQQKPEPISHHLKTLFTKSGRVDPSQFGPVSAFKQLLSVLPAGSKQLVPKELQRLYERGSAVSDFYPTDFALDVDGVKVSQIF